MSEKTEESCTEESGKEAKTEELANSKQKTVTFKIEPKTIKKPVRRLKNKSSPANVGVAFKGNFVSQIPKAVLMTPSSSENALTTNISTDGNLAYTIGPKSIMKSQLPSYLTLQRQRTAAIIKFRSRKAVSQMDFKEARRTGNLPPLPNSQALVPVLRDQNQITTEMGGELEPLYEDNSDVAAGGAIFYRASFSRSIEEMCYMRTASLRIFNIIMLNSWRKRREEVRQLNEQIDRGTRCSIKIKNQLHIFKSLFRSEQLRNNDLGNKVRYAVQELTKCQAEQKELQKKLENAKVAEEVLKQELLEKYTECEGVNVMLEDTKSKLFQTMSSERNLLCTLSNAQREVQKHQLENDELNQLVEISKTKYEKVMLQLDDIIAERDELLMANDLALEKCGKVEQELQKKSQELSDFKAKERCLLDELELVKSQISTLQQCLAATLGNRLKNCFNQSVDYHRATYQMLHWVAFYILPAAPPPRVTALPVGLAIRKVKAFFDANFLSKSKEVLND